MGAIFFEGSIEENFWGHIFAEVYKDRVYAPFLEGKENLTIMDVGANIGITTHYFSQFAKKVYSIEPAQEHQACIKKMIEYNGLVDKVVPIQCAVYMQDGEFPLFHHPGNKTMFSLHSAVQGPTKDEELVKTKTLATIFKENNIDHIDFMKLDVEGSEYEILGHVSFDEVAPKIDSMLVEMHAWANRNPNQIKESLRSRGFKVQIIPNDASLLYASK